MMIAKGKRLGTIRIHKPCLNCGLVEPVEVNYIDFLQAHEGLIKLEDIKYLTDKERHLLKNCYCNNCSENDLFNNDFDTPLTDEMDEQEAYLTKHLY